MTQADRHRRMTTGGVYWVRWSAAHGPQRRIFIAEFHYDPAGWWPTPTRHVYTGWWLLPGSGLRTEWQDLEPIAGPLPVPKAP